MRKYIINKSGLFIAILATTVLAGLTVAGCGSSEEPGTSESVTVFAAASTSQVMEKIARQFEREYGISVESNFASSGSLVKQIQYGNSPDIFISASVKWMDAACDEKLVDSASRIDFLGNRLVLVSQASNPVEISLGDNSWTDRVSGIVAMGDPSHVPAGTYGKEALEYYGCYHALEGRLSNSASVSSALMLVETGQTQIGIVYENNAAMSDKTVISARFSEESHNPIVYPAVLGNEVSSGARLFFSFLQGPYAHAMFEAHGFIPLTDILMPEEISSSMPAAWFNLSTLSPTLSSIWLSLKVALVSVLFLLAPCVGLGWLLAKKNFRGKHVLSALVQVPLVIPPVATGYLLLIMLGKNSAVGGWFESVLGLSISFNWIAAVVASSVVSMPLLVKAVRVAMENVDSRIEDASKTLGNSAFATFFKVTLPLSLHGIVAGGILCFSRAMGEFGATITFAGNIAGKTRTIPLATFNYIQSPGGEHQAMALICVSVAVSVVSVAVVEWLTARKMVW